MVIVLVGELSPDYVNSLSDRQTVGNKLATGHALVLRTTNWDATKYWNFAILIGSFDLIIRHSALFPFFSAVYGHDEVFKPE